MPFRQSDLMDERIRFVVAASRWEQSLAALCREFGISRPTGYLWLERYREAGSVTALSERSCRPHRMPRLTPSRLVDEIVSLRLAHGWGARKLRVLLAHRGETVSESTINRVLKRQGLIYTREVSGKATRRFERTAPNELWQMDFKGPYRLATGRCVPFSIIDDHSRYAIGLFAFDNQLTDTVHQALVTRFERYGVPQAILTDHGVPWWGNSNEHGLTRLSIRLIRQGIRLCFSGVRHPQTQGKVERFHRTISEMVRHHGRPTTLSSWQTRFDDFREEYNHLRPHEALGLDVPASRYHPSNRPYRPNPRDWEYPSGAKVVRLNQQGMLPWQTKRFFVCEALANEYVQITECSRKLLIRFRHTWIREIDPDNGRSASLIDKKQKPYV